MTRHSPIDWNELAVAVKDACPVPDLQVTPGSLRRVFVWSIIALYTVDNVTDWKAVIRCTGHKRVETAKAYYQKDLK